MQALSMDDMAVVRYPSYNVGFHMLQGVGLKTATSVCQQISLA